MNRDLLRVLILAVLAFVLILTKEAHSSGLKFTVGDGGPSHDTRLGWVLK